MLQKMLDKSTPFSLGAWSTLTCAFVTSLVLRQSIFFGSWGFACVAHGPDAIAFVKPQRAGASDRAVPIAESIFIPTLSVWKQDWVVPTTERIFIPTLLVWQQDCCAGEGRPWWIDNFFLSAIRIQLQQLPGSETSGKWGRFLLFLPFFLAFGFVCFLTACFPLWILLLWSNILWSWNL